MTNLVHHRMVDVLRYKKCVINTAANRMPHNRSLLISFRSVCPEYLVENVIRYRSFRKFIRTEIEFENGS